MPLEHAVYRRSKLIVGVYVDDLVITGPSAQETEEFKAQMKSMSSMSDLGLLSYYLGNEVKKTKEGISLNESSYAAIILQKSGMQHCNPTQTPINGSKTALQ
jgi:histone deacetylase 1/2